MLCAGWLTLHADIISASVKARSSVSQNITSDSRLHVNRIRLAKD